jgi:serine/alanine adding enzyme
VPAPELIEVEPSRWDAMVRGLGVSDVYYSRGFVEASAPLAGGTATLLHASGDGGDVVFPCVVRSDPTDIVTPYGYGGPLALGDAPPAFAEAYQAWCERRGVVSSFVVFHPLFGNGGAPFRTSALAGTVAWPLDGGDLLAAMHSHHRRVVRRARERLQVAIDPAPTDLDEFVAVYEHTMRRSDASAFYFFDAPYWDALLEGVPLVRVDVREPGGELLSSVLGMGEPPFLHYHLGGTADAGRKAGASHLALYSLARWGQEHGYTRLHLGGGVGGRDDSLLEFKRRFAPDGLVPATVGKAVHDEAAYRRLAGGAEIDWDGFFPAYRAPR